MQNWLTRLIKKLPTARQLWFPLLFVSAAFHGLLLALPLPSEPDSELEPEPEETVKITSLVSPESSSPEPPAASAQESTPPPAAQPAPTPRQQPQPPLPTVPELPPVPPLEEPQAEVEPEVPNQEPEEAASESEAPAESESELAAANSGNTGPALIDELRTRVLRRLNERGATTNSPEEMVKAVDDLPVILVESDQRSYFFAGQNLKPGAIDSLWIPQTDESEAFEDYVRPVLTEAFGFTVETLKPYGEANLYKAQNTEGIEVYMSLVGLRGSGAFVVLWQKDPRVSN